MKKIAVFASGSGSDFQSVIDANEKEPFCEISLLVASKEGIGAIERAKKHGIEYIVRSKKDYPSVDAMFADIVEELKGIIGFQKIRSHFKGILEALLIFVKTSAPVFYLVIFSGFQEADDTF